MKMKKTEKEKKLILYSADGFTERKLFNVLNTKLKNYSLKNARDLDAGGGPRDIIKKLLKLPSAKRKMYHKIFAIFDLDSRANIEEIKKYIEECKEKGFHIIFTNICIENWFFLFHDKGLGRFNSGSDVKKNLKIISNGKYSGETNFDVEFYLEKKNIEKAKKKIKKDMEENNYTQANILKYFNQKIIPVPATNFYEIFDFLEEEGEW